MSVGFGFSAGDFIQALELIGTVIDALRETSEATVSYQALISELESLQTALQRFKDLDAEVRQEQRNATERAASQCQQSIDAFYARIQKYQPHLQLGGTDSKVKDAWMKIKWVMCKKEDLERFRAEIRGHTSSLDILLLAISLERISAGDNTQRAQQASLASRIQSATNQIMSKLDSVSQSVALCVRQGKRLLNTSAQIVQLNLRIFQIVHDIQTHILRIPGEVQMQQPVYFIDPFNKSSPFHLDFVRSKEGFLAILKANFEFSGCDPKIIDRRQFVIEEAGTLDPIDLAGPWDACFHPGQRVNMSVVFDQCSQANPTTCPRCKNENKAISKDISW